MKNYVEFKLNDEQLKSAEKIVEAIRAYNEALKDAFISGKVSFETKTAADLFFTENAAESILFKKELWRNQCESAAKELQSLDYICENNPESIAAVKEELENLHDAFASSRDLMKLID